MGAYDHEEKRPKQRRGSVNNARRLDAFAERETKAGGAGWDTADPRWIAAVIVAVTRLGGAATFGLSRDQGAHMLTLMLDGDRKTLWFNGDADLNLELEKVYAVLETM